MKRRTSGMGLLGTQRDSTTKLADTAAVPRSQEFRKGGVAIGGRHALTAPETTRRSAKHRISLSPGLQAVEDGALQLGGGIANPDILKHLSIQDIRDLRLVFDAFDTDSSGLIDEKELRRAFRSLGFKTSRKAVHDMIADVDLDGSGQLDFEEFLQCVISHQGDSRDMHGEIMHGFHLFDTEHKGKITLSDLRRACDLTGEKMTDQDLQEMIEEADRDGDNAVSKQEFMNIMLRTNLFL